MRTSIILIAALTALASPAFAQERTPPAGSILADEAPIDSFALRQNLTRQNQMFEGRSVGYDNAPSVQDRSQDAE